MNDRKCGICDQEIDLFKFYSHSLSCALKESHNNNIDIKKVINETLEQLNIPYSLKKTKDKNKTDDDFIGRRLRSNLGMNDEYLSSPSRRLRTTYPASTSTSPSPSLSPTTTQTTTTTTTTTTPPTPPQTTTVPPNPPIIWRTLINNHCGGTTCLASRCTQRVAQSNATNFALIIKNENQQYQFRFCESGKHFKDIDQLSKFRGVLQEAFILVRLHNNIDETSTVKCFHGREKAGSCDNLVGTNLYIESIYHKIKHYYCRPECALQHLANISTTKWRNMHKANNSETVENNDENGNEDDVDYEGSGDGGDGGGGDAEAGENGEDGSGSGSGARGARGARGSRGGRTPNRVGENSSIVDFINKYQFHGVDLFKNIVGINFNDLLLLWNKVKYLFLNLDKNGNLIKDCRGNNRGIKNYLALLLTLIKLRSNFSFKFLSYWFSISETQCRSIFHHMLNCLSIFFKGINSVHLLSEYERLARGHWLDLDQFHISRRLTMFIDGNLTPTSSAPTKNSRIQMFSGKDKKECFSILGIVDGLGKFNFISHSFPGSIPDQVSLHFQSLVNTIEKLTDKEFLVADAAFPHLRQYCDNLVIPIYPKDQANMNKDISKHRSLIERAWCQLEKWKIVTKFRIGWSKKTTEEVCDQHKDTFFILASLYNIFNQNLGEVDTRPSKYQGVQYPRPNVDYHYNLLLQSNHNTIKKILNIK
ncbi:hypothetical protein ACTFIW_004393 [Dictyostelium discoideum]